MKKFTIQLQNSNFATKKITIPINQCPKNIKVVDANLEFKATSGSGRFNIKFSTYPANSQASWDNVDIIDITAGKSFKINISDELQQGLNLNSINMILEFVGTQDFTFYNIGQVEIDYYSLAQYQENGTSHNVDLGQAGQASIELSTKKLSLLAPVSSSDNNNLPLALYAHYNEIENNVMPNIGLPKNWGLNIQQFLVKNNDKDKLSFCYIDENGKNQIIEEKYYYYDEKNTKTYIDNMQNLHIDLDQNLSYEKEIIVSTILNDGTGDFYSWVTTNFIDTLKNTEDILEWLNKVENSSIFFQLDSYGNTKKYNLKSKSISNTSTATLLFTNGSNKIEIKIEPYPDINSIPQRIYKIQAENPVSGIPYLVYKSSKSYKVKKEIKTPTGLNFVSSIKDIKGCELIDFEPEELASIREQITQLQLSKIPYENSLELLKKQIFISGMEKRNNMLQIIATHLKIKFQEDNTKNKIEHEIYTNTNTEEDLIQLIKDDIGEETFYEIYDYKFIDFYNELVNASNEKLSLAANFTEEYNELYSPPKLIDSSILSSNISLQNLVSQFKNYKEQLAEIDKKLQKYQHQEKLLEMQVPQYYLYDENTIYGFGKTSNKNIFRLILITDSYENAVYINYKDLESNEIENISDSNEKLITFSYTNDKLTSITDSRDRITKFTQNDNNLIITHQNSQRSVYFFDNNKKITSVLDESGMGAKFTYNGDTIEINPLSIIEKVEDGNLLYKGKNTFDYFLTSNLSYFVLNDEKVVLKNNNFLSTTLTNAKNKSITYNFDKYGKVKSIYEDNFTGSEKHPSLSTEFVYSEDKCSQKISTLINSENYLSDVCFDASTLTNESALSLNGDISICGENTLSYSTTTHATFHTIAANATTKTKSVVMSPTMLNLLKQTDSTCNHSAYVVSGWAKANSAFITPAQDNTTNKPNRRFEISAVVTYSDNTKKYFAKSFDWRNTYWQYCALPLNIDRNKTLTRIECTLDYSNNTGAIEFTDFEFKEADWEKTTYDDDNRITSITKAHSDFKTEYTYIGDSKNISQEIVTNNLDNSKYITTYEYNKQNKLIRSTDYRGIVNENVYNDKGVIIQTLTYHKDEPTCKLCQTKVLDDKGNETEILNDLGECVSKIEYVNGTGIVKSYIKDNVKTSFGYSKDDTLLEQTITVDGTENTNTYGYTFGYLTSVKHNNFCFTYKYDSKGRLMLISLPDYAYLYNAYSNNEVTTNLINGEKFRQTFSDSGKVLNTYYKKDNNATETLISSNIYDNQDNLVSYRDLTNGEENVYNIYYNKFEKVYKETSTQHGAHVVVQNNFEDGENISESGKINGLANHEQIENTLITVDDKNLFYNFTYDDLPDHRLTSILLPNDIEQTISYDNLGRVSKIDNGISSKEFQYLKSGDHTSNLVANTRFAINNKVYDNLHYVYDKNGNITEVRNNNNLIARYKYDALSRLVREDNKELNISTTISYDQGGNILNKSTYEFTLAENLDSLPCSSILYTYPSTGWRDQLTELTHIDIDGNKTTERFVNSKLGHSFTYRNKTLVWSHGRQLDRFHTTNFKYNSNGIRISKTTNGVITKFFLSGNKIISQHEQNGNTFSNDMFFHYGADGLTGFSLNGEEYMYKKNPQNDIIGIIDKNGQEIVRYAYDAWGFCTKFYLLTNGNYSKIEDDYDGVDTSIINRFIASKNPFLYRSYYFDNETNLYYLNSRYYDPEIGRFINADDISTLDISNIALNGLNLFAYCLNNPVNEVDESGYILLTLLFGFLLGTIVGFTSSVITQGLTSGWDNINWKVTILDSIFSGISGLVGASPIGILGQVLIGGVLSVLQYSGGQLIRGDELSTFGILTSFGLGMLFSSSNGLLYGNMPGKNISKTLFVNQIQKETIKLIKKESFNKAFLYFSKHIFSNLLSGFIVDMIKTAGITSGINIFNFWAEYGFKKFFNN